MNRYEVTVYSTLGLEPKHVGTWEISAGSPNVALRRLLTFKSFGQLTLDFNMMLSLKFNVINRGKVIWIGEVGKSGNRTYILASDPMPEGWGKVVRMPNGEKIVT
tara:strand:- start:101 stop:415 length:315 start_codon:yes stop_codon:yes gene_type:complete